MNKLNIVAQALPMILFVFGLISFVIAGFLFNLILGVSVLGIALIIMAWIVSPVGIKQ